LPLFLLKSVQIFPLDFLFINDYYLISLLNEKYSMLRRNNMKKSVGLILIGCGLLAGSLTGCSNKPSDEEMKQLNDLKAEVTSLEKSISDAEVQKAALLRSIAEKDAQLTQCAQDKDALQARLKSMH
jgi:septal ring factor EnvC (AmiA/AmiB activator)